MPIHPAMQDEIIEVALEFDGGRHALLDIFGRMAELPNLHEYIIVPIVEGYPDAQIYGVTGYSFVHISDDLRSELERKMKQSSH